MPGAGWLLSKFDKMQVSVGAGGYGYSLDEQTAACLCV